MLTRLLKLSDPNSRSLVVAIMLLPFLRVFLWLGAIGAASVVFLGQGGALTGQGSIHGRTDAVTVFAVPLADDNDNEDDGGPPPGPARTAPDAPLCSTPGQEMAFSSADGRFTVRVFSNMNRPIGLAVRLVDPSTVPAVPGPLVDKLLFEILAEFCDGGGAIAELPFEVNLGIRYSDEEAAGLDEQNFVIAMLDSVNRQWLPTPKQVPDPGSNYLSATIQRLGFYAVHQSSG